MTSILKLNLLRHPPVAARIKYALTFAIVRSRLPHVVASLVLTR